MARRNNAQVDVGRYLVYMDKSYSDIIKSNRAQQRHNRLYNQILINLSQLRIELNLLNKIIDDIDSIDNDDILTQLMNNIENIQHNKKTEMPSIFLNLQQLLNNSSSDHQALINRQANKCLSKYDSLKQNLKDAFLLNIDMQKSFHKDMPEFFDFISIQGKNGKTNLFMLDQKQLASFINNKELVDFVPTLNKKKEVTDFSLKLKRTASNSIDFDDKLLSYLSDTRNAYFLNNTVADQIFNNNSTYQQFMNQDKFYNQKMTKQVSNKGIRTELMLNQLLHGSTIEEAYQNKNNSMWTTQYSSRGKVRNILNTNAEFGGAVGDALGAIGINRTTKEFTFLNNAYTNKDTINMEKVYGNFQIKSLDLNNPFSTFSFGSASSIIANNAIFTNKKEFDNAKMMYYNYVMMDYENRAPKEDQRQIEYNTVVSQAGQLARDFVFSFADGLSDAELIDMDDAASGLSEELTNYFEAYFSEDYDA